MNFSIEIIIVIAVIVFVIILQATSNDNNKDVNPDRSNSKLIQINFSEDNSPPQEETEDEEVSTQQPSFKSSPKRTSLRKIEYRIALIGLLGALFGSLSSIEAAKISIRSELDTGNDLGYVAYRERSVYRSVGDSSAAKAYPYADRIGNNTFANSDYMEFTIDAAVTNLYGNIWYRLDSNKHYYPQSISGESYIYSGNVIYIKDAAEIKWVNNNINKQSLPIGYPISLNGIITSTNRMTRITASIYKGSRCLGSFDDIPSNNPYYYTMNNSRLNTLLDFDVLSISDDLIGGDWKLILSIDYLSEGGLQTLTKEISNNFEVMLEPYFKIKNDNIHAVYQGNGSSTYAVKRYPRAGGRKEYTLDNYTNAQFIIIAEVINEFGNTWYQLDPEVHPYDGQPAYISSDDVHFVESLK